MNIKFNKLRLYKLFIAIFVCSLYLCFHIYKTAGYYVDDGVVLPGILLTLLSFPLSILWLLVLRIVIPFFSFEGDYLILFNDISFFILIYVNWGCFIPWIYFKTKSKKIVRSEKNDPNENAQKK